MNFALLVFGFDLPSGLEQMLREALEPGALGLQALPSDALATVEHWLQTP